MKVILIYEVDNIEQSIEIVSTATKKCWLKSVRIGLGEMKNEMP